MNTARAISEISRSTGIMIDQPPTQSPLVSRKLPRKISAAPKLAKPAAPALDYSGTDDITEAEFDNEKLVKLDRGRHDE